MALPWDVVVAALPTLIDSAGKLWKRANESAKEPEPPPESSVATQLQALQSRLERSERLEAEQAELLRKTIEQLQQTVLRCAALERRTNFAIGAALVAAAVALAALLMR